MAKKIVAKTLTNDEYEALDQINENLQMLTGDIHLAYNDYFHDYKPEPKGLYPIWIEKIREQINSKNDSINTIVNQMVDRAIPQFKRQSIFDAEKVLYKTLAYLNDYYRPFWEPKQKERLAKLA